jgi:uncharacterized protein (TIGR02598 family)
MTFYLQLVPEVFYHGESYVSNLFRLMHSKPSPRSAFSLVEVVLALGVTSFSLTIILGLLPVSLAAFTNAKRDSIRANILQDVAANASLTPYASMSTLNSQVWYYDNQSQKLTSSSTAIYSATMTVSPPSPLPGQSAGTVNACVVQIRTDCLNGNSQPIPSLAATNSVIVANQGN